MDWAATPLTGGCDQFPPGRGDACFFSSSTFSLDNLASKSRIWASSSKGVSLYSIRSHSLNYKRKRRIFMKCKTLFRGLEVPRTHLVRLRGLELLELILETQVGASAGSDHLHGSQRLLPAHSCHRHDVSYHQGDAAGNTCQAAKGQGRNRDGFKLNTAQNLSSALHATVSSITWLRSDKSVSSVGAIWRFQMVGFPGKRCHFSSTALEQCGLKCEIYLASAHACPSFFALCPPIQILAELKLQQAASGEWELNLWNCRRSSECGSILEKEKEKGENPLGHSFAHISSSVVVQ